MRILTKFCKILNKKGKHALVVGVVLLVGLYGGTSPAI
ncbi:hypothetical protein HBZS_117980 [Helicobacter bizzozeronii CCUG 35545]|nr:hypothetical protein HBZS_117980 [Helicobacter bizzozeronii CCUG 35545]